MKVHVPIYGKRSEVHNKNFTNIIPGQWDWFCSLLFSFHFLYFLPFLNEWPLLLESEKVQSLEIFYLLVIGSLTQIHLIMIVIIFIIFYYHPYYMWHIVIEKVKCKRDSWGWMGELSASPVILSLAWPHADSHQGQKVAAQSTWVPCFPDHIQWEGMGTFTSSLEHQLRIHRD